MTENKTEFLPFNPTHRHKKRGTEYQVLGDASLQTEFEITEGTMLRVYIGDDGKMWARPCEEFADGRFEEIPDTRATITPSDKAAALEAFDYMDKNDLILVMMEYKTGVTYHTDKSIELTGAIKRAALQQLDDGEVVKALEFYADLDNFRGDYLGSGSDGPFSNVSSDQGLKARKALLTYRNKKV